MGSFGSSSRGEFRKVTSMTTNRKGSFEARMDELLPQWDSFDLTFHGLLREAEGGWSVNDSWTAYRGCDRQEAIEHLRGRWEIFKVNYLPKARVADITDNGDGEGECLLDVDCTALATVRQGGGR